jgi:hypothetical protein
MTGTETGIAAADRCIARVAGQSLLSESWVLV